MHPALVIVIIILVIASLAGASYGIYYAVKSAEMEHKATTGTVQLNVTDKPPEGITSIIVVAKNFRVKQGASEMAADGKALDEGSNGSDAGGSMPGGVLMNGSEDTDGWISLVEEEKTFDLVAVKGIEESLGITDLSPGQYNQLRMDIVSVTAVKEDGTEYPVKVPSSVLRFVHPFYVAAGEGVILTIDFDADRSIVETKPNEYILKPVVQLLSRPGKTELRDNQTF